MYKSAENSAAPSARARRVGEVVGKILVEFPVFLLRDLGLLLEPDGFPGIEDLFLGDGSLLLRVLLVRCGAGHVHDDGVRDVV
jgi:hypothetical protein